MPATERELETAKLLGRMDAKLDQILNDNDTIRSDVDKLKEDHQSMKNRQNYIAGGLAAFGTLMILARDKLSMFLFGA